MPMQVTTAPLFAAELTPPRAMNPVGLRLVIAETVLLAAWPAFALVGLDARLVALAMTLTVAAIGITLYKSFDVGKRREHVLLYSETLEVMFVAASGARQQLRFDPRSVRLVIERDINERATALKLRTRDGDTEIGAFLTQEERSGFAKAFGTALRKARA